MRDERFVFLTPYIRSKALFRWGSCIIRAHRMQLRDTVSCGGREHRSELKNVIRHRGLPNLSDLKTHQDGSGDLDFRSLACLLKTPSLVISVVRVRDVGRFVPSARAAGTRSCEAPVRDG